MSNFEYSQQNPWSLEERTNATKLLHIITLINANEKNGHSHFQHSLEWTFLDGGAMFNLITN